VLILGGAYLYNLGLGLPCRFFRVQMQIDLTQNTIRVLRKLVLLSMTFTLLCSMKCLLGGG
jgi:hypothetical protein